MTRKEERQKEKEARQKERDRKFIISIMTRIKKSMDKRNLKFSDMPEDVKEGMLRLENTIGVKIYSVDQGTENDSSLQESGDEE